MVETRAETVVRGKPRGWGLLRGAGVSGVMDPKRLRCCDRFGPTGAKAVRRGGGPGRPGPANTSEHDTQWITMRGPGDAA